MSQWKISGPETILDKSSGDPALLESRICRLPCQWLAEPSCSVLGGRVPVSASGGSARFSWVGVGVQHADKLHVGVRHHQSLLVYFKLVTTFVGKRNSNPDGQSGFWRKGPCHCVVGISHR